MKKVITYGTYDLLHFGHVRLLERAKALGDYLIVGVTADGFDQVRGKINVSQTLNERMEAVRALGIADEIIVEEYEGQKIDDIKRLGVDIFTVGSDWEGKFDYLKEFCEVVYLDRTEGVSSSEIRAEKNELKLGIVGNNNVAAKHLNESSFVNGIVFAGYWADSSKRDTMPEDAPSFATYDELLDASDAVFIVSHPTKRYEQTKAALEAGKHVLCEAPLALSKAQCAELFELADAKNLILAEGIKTAYSTAYHRLLLLAKSGHIGRVVSVEATCTSLSDFQRTDTTLEEKWTSSTEWGPWALLPLLQLLGTDYVSTSMVKCPLEKGSSFDNYGKINLVYPGSFGSATFGNGVKSEGSLVVSGTNGYIYVPAPWWKTDYFEVRKEDTSQNRRFFYQLDGEGIRYELVMFARAIENNNPQSLSISRDVSLAISGLMEAFANDDNCAMLEPISSEQASVGESVAR